MAWHFNVGKVLEFSGGEEGPTAGPNYEVLKGCVDGIDRRAFMYDTILLVNHLHTNYDLFQKKSHLDL